jgi:hypothetical protein
MDAVVEPLVLDLVEWLASCDRTYQEALSAWGTSCPKLPVWEEAHSRGLVTTEIVCGRSLLKPTSLGLILAEQRRETGRYTRPAPPRWFSEGA